MQNEKKSFNYKLEASQFDQAFAILQKEQQANMPSRRQKIIFTLLKIAVYGFVVTLILLAIIIITGIHKQVPVIIFIIPMCVFLLMMTILFFLNLPLLIKFWRQSKLVRRLGLSKILKAPWRAQLKRKKFTRITTIIIGIFGLLIILFGLLGGSGLFTGRFGEKEDFIAGGILVMIGLILIFTQYMRRGKERLEFIASLRSSLRGYKDASEKGEDKLISIPSKYYEMIANIERDQISRERRESILFNIEQPEDSTYIIQKSRNVIHALAKLDPVTRLRVQGLIDKLITEPLQPGATKEPKTETRRLRVPETPVEICFIVDDDDRRIKILSLQMIAADNEKSSSELGG